MPRVGLADPVTEAPGLRDAAAKVRKRQPADQHLVAAEQEERVSLIGPLILGVAPQPSPERTTGKIVRRPGRLPWREERAACLAQRRPVGVVAALRRAQEHALPFDHGKRLGKIDGAEERHRA